MNALKILLEKLKKEYADTALPLETPLICSVDYIGDNMLDQLAAEYYSGDKMTKFVAVFPALDATIQKSYCDRMYSEGKIAFFAATLNKMDADTIRYFAEKAYADNKVNFFSMIIPFLNEETQNEWIVKSSKDGKNGFLAMLTS